MIALHIAVVGSHGVGKTELVLKLSEKIGLPVIVEQAREVAKEIRLSNCDELLTNPDLARNYQWQVLNRQIQMQLKHHNGFISDRSTLDCIAYWKFYLDEPNSKETKQYLNKARIHAWKRLNLIFYIPPSRPLVNDGFRLSVHVEEVDKYICEELNLIKNWGVPVLTINSLLNRKDIEDALKQVTKLQGGLLRAK